MYDNASPIFQLYVKLHTDSTRFSFFEVMQNSCYFKDYTFKFNNTFNEIITDPNYDPNTWLIEYKNFSKICPAPHLTLMRFIEFLNVKNYNKLPEQMWVLICKLNSDKIKQEIENGLQCEFLEQVFLLSEFQ